VSVVEALAIVVAVAACATDVARRRVPNALTLSAAVGGLVAHTVIGGAPGLGVALLGAAVGLAVFFPIFVLGGMGGGDVKLMAALGAWVGPAAIGWTALYGAIAGGIIGVAVAVGHGYLRQALTNVGSLLHTWSLVGIRPVPAYTLEHGTGPRLPYALPILAGLVTALWRH
jgi:prepilin peptidase CpaA